MSDDLPAAMAAVKTWLGNPISMYILRFLIKDDKCGNRLENSIDYYLGERKDLCVRCRLGGFLVGQILHKSSQLFGVEETSIKAGLKAMVFKRGMLNVLQGISRYGITKPQRVNAPFLVVWDFTHMCNLRCKHCYQDARQALADELSTQECKSLIDQFAQAGVVVIAFSGGEPLMRKDFFEVADYARGKGIYVALASNGTLITPEIARRLKEVGALYVEISIDGRDAASHDGMRGIEGAFDRSVQGLKNCVAEDLYTCVATTVTRENYDQVPEIYALSRELKVRRLMLFNFIPTGRGIAMANLDITPQQREDLLEYMLTVDREGGGPECLSTAPQLARKALEAFEEGGVPVGHFYLGNALQGKTRMLADFIGGCGAGRLYCSIEPTGDVYPCVFMPLPVGNIRDQDFLTIWHQSPLLNQLRDREHLSGGCGECDHRLVCGGCRARALAYFGDLTAPDPGCIRNAVYWERLKAQSQEPVVSQAGLLE